MRFNDPQRVQAYKANGEFPSIHSPLVSCVVEHVIGRRGLDLCCSHGLLGEQLLTKHGFQMIGVDGDASAVELARANGVKMPIHHIKLDAQTLPLVYQLIRANKIEVLIARRCFPELFGDDLELGGEFFGEIRAAGIKEIALEGRVQTPKATNRLSSVWAEIRLAQLHYEVSAKDGNCAILRVL
jgi:hypothetical protein